MGSKSACKFPPSNSAYTSPYSQSINLLSMPDFQKKLKLKNDNQQERVTEMRDLGFNRKVLVGNWFEDQDHACITHANTYRTTYDADYAQPSCAAVYAEKQSVDNEIWNNRIHGEGDPDLLVIRQGGAGEDKKDKKATTYDLAYRCKVKDFVDGNYGSVTQFGLAETKKPKWEREANERKYMYLTEYKESYVPHKLPIDKDGELRKTPQYAQGNCYVRNTTRIIPTNLAKA